MSHALNWPLHGRSRAIGPAVAQEMRKMILSNELHPDQHLVETELANSFDVSRGPVREALKELARDGLIRAARQGYRVASFTTNDVRELHDLRFVLESHAIQAAQKKQESWDGLEEINERFSAAAKVQDYQTLVEADTAFHAYFYDVADNKALNITWGSLKPLMTALLEVSIFHIHDFESAALEHNDIVAALRENESAWQAHLKKHLERASTRYLNVLEDLRSEE